MLEGKLPSHNHPAVQKAASFPLLALPHILEPLYKGISLSVPVLVWANHPPDRYNHPTCALIIKRRVGFASQFSYLEEVELR